MMHAPHRQLFTGLSLASALGLTAGAGASYSFVRVADSSGAFMFFGVPSINASGAVAFQAVLDGGAQAINVGSGGALTPIASSGGGGPFISVGPGPDINDSGLVAFQANIAGGQAIYTGSGGATTQVVSTSGSFSTIGQPSINNAGRIACSANLDAGGAGIYSIFGGVTTTIATTAGPLSSFLGDAQVTSGTTVALRANLDAGGQTVQVGSGGPMTPIAITTGAPYAGLGSHAVSPNGTVVYQASLDAGGQGIFQNSGAGPITIADSSGPFSEFFAASINAGGDVAFLATLDDGGIPGLFTGADPAADKVIAGGDSLDGSTVSGFVYGTHALNEAGQLAFVAILADGRRGVYVATPNPALPGDLNGDGHVNGLDIALMLGQWTGAGSYSPCPPHAQADLNQDCKINGLDLAIMLGAWTG